MTKVKWTDKQIKGTKKSSYLCCVDYSDGCDDDDDAICNNCVFHSEDNKKEYIEYIDVGKKLDEMGL